MNFEWHDAIGALGVTLILLAYLLLQLGRLKAEALAYSALNWLGAAFVLVSLSREFNLASAVLESIWLVISSVGIAGWILQRRNGVEGAIDERDAAS